MMGGRFRRTIGKVAALPASVLGDRERKITIPYGRHTYGPQPQVIGVLPWVRRLSEGTRIGNYCSIGPGVRFLFLGKHNLEWVTTYPFQAFYERWKVDAEEFRGGDPDMSHVVPDPIIVGSDVWIASNASIKQGVRIGDGAVIAMESLVTKDVPPYAIVGGNPARLIRFRFDRDLVDELLAISWWNWEDEDVRRVVPYLVDDNIEEFIRVARNMRGSREDAPSP